jgi:hypothetical protein
MAETEAGDQGTPERTQPVWLAEAIDDYIAEAIDDYIYEKRKEGFRVTKSELVERALTCYLGLKLNGV